MFKKLIILVSLILIIEAKFLDNLDRSFSGGDDKVLEISVTLSNYDYNKVIENVQVQGYAAFSSNINDYETVANITISDNEKVNVFPDSKFKTAGNFAKSFCKPGFNIELSDKFYKRKSFRLRADINDVSHLRQKIVCDVANRVGLPSIQSTYVRLTINGHLYGLFTLMDTLKPVNIKKLYNTETNKKELELYQCKEMGFKFTTVTSSFCENDADKDRGIGEFRKLMADVERATTIDDLDKVLNVDIFLKYIALEYVIGSFDHALVLGHNFYFYKSEINNKWDIIYYDFDNTIGQGMSDWPWFGSKNSGVTDYTTLNFKQFYNNQKFFDILVNNDNTRFKKNLQEVLTYGYNPVLLNEHINDLKTLIYPYVKEDYTPINGELPGRVNKKGYQMDTNFESYEKNSEYGTVSHNELMGRMNVPGIKAYIEKSFNHVCSEFKLDKEQILRDAVTLTPTSFFTRIKNGISPYDATEINQINEACWSEQMGYPCCKGCNVIYVEDGLKWGVENEQWCGIVNSVCQKQDYCQKSDYPCCKACNELYSDGSGRYGIENNEWCILKYNC